MRTETGFQIAMLILVLMNALAIAVPPPDFVHDVRPILERSCFGCHGPEKKKSGYRLDVRDVALKGGDSGEAAIVPHNAKSSPLIRYVSGEDEEMLMPPEQSGKARLTKAEVDTLRAWIDAGPAWPEELASASGDGKGHWSLRPLVQSAVPVGQANPIDAFIRAKLALNKLAPTPAAERRTLIRRLNYDLIGLPPTPEEVDAFVEDQTPTAFDSLVTRLLASPRHGEHWARHWLDVAHYADTHGNDHDYARPNAWPYRDYVIRAFNDDKPYSRFIQEQVAGDALFPNDPQATVALGFLAAGPWDETLMVGVREDTVDHRFAQVLDRDDMVTTVMSTFTALTTHCARCHNHKFDPISQREYYALQAVFAGIDRADRFYDLDDATHIRRRELLVKRTAIARRDADTMASLDTPEMRREIASFMKACESRQKLWQPLEVVSVTNASGAATSFARQADGSWFVSGERPETDTYIVTAQVNANDVRAIRLEAMRDDRLSGKGPGRYDPSGNFHLTEFRAQAQPSSGQTKGATRLEFSRVTADHGDSGDTIANAIDGKANTYWSIHPRYGEPHEAVFELKEPLGHDPGTTLIVRLEQTGKPGHQLGRFRLSYCTGLLSPEERAPLPATLVELLRKPEAERTREEHRELSLRVLGYKVDRDIAALPAPRMVYAVARDFPPTGSFKPAVTPRPIHVLMRGDLNKPGEPVEPGALSCVQGLGAALAISNPGDESARRAALALWLTDDRNSLTWRCIVNRVWHYHFGRGLSDTPNDFGRMGGTPSHPELLDWLALWFRDQAKGSLKALHRLIVTSETYRQSALDRADAAVRDPDNHLLWRMNRARLTAEQVRDSLVQTSGRLDLTMGGPSIVQFVHRGKATFMPVGGAPPFLDYDGFAPDAPENRRRAIYRFLFRTVPDPFMDALDTPDGGSLTPVRGQSTTVFGAFALLNNAFVIRQCEHIASRLDRESGDNARVARAFRLLLLRDPRAEELARFADYTRQHGLANACQVIINSNEFLYID
jgi:Protein of unknown function (DUF1549)/Protein of unknown function (DUF1553)/Planctomycete cytochrome C